LGPTKGKVKLKRSSHCYKLRHIKDEKRPKLHRLGSGFFQPVPYDSLLLGYLLPRMPVIK